MSQKDLTNDTLDKVIELNEPWQDQKRLLIYCTKEIDCKIAAAITYRMIEKYYGLVMINFVSNGFEGDLPNDLWEYHYIVMIGVSPSETGMRTIRSMIHDKNIAWLDNKERNIPMWNEYSMIPGYRSTEYSLTELAWRFYHDMSEAPDTLKLLMFDRSVIEMSEMI